MNDMEPPSSVPRYRLLVPRGRSLRDDEYTLCFVPTGWYISHLSINGYCNPEGSPKLIENFDHDSVRYPDTLGFQMSSLWQKIKRGELADDDISSYFEEITATLRYANSPKQKNNRSPRLPE